jgi:hypothetical protein
MANKSNNDIEKERKNGERAVREDMLDEGALLLQFTVDRKDGIDIDRSALQQWRNVEKKGFLVTKSGCIIPAPCHRYGNSKKKKPACTIAMTLFRGETKDPATVSTVNEHGWPTDDQLSHLCHDDACCCYKDLAIEPRWKNLKRNYCGFNGTCDCGCIPICKRRYMPSNATREYDDILRYGDPGLSREVKRLLEMHSEHVTVTVKILPKDQYVVQDAKRANRNQRIKKQKRHDKERDRNEEKRAKKRQKK